MKSKIGCENRYGIFFNCDDCCHADNPPACAAYRSDLDAKIGYEIRG